MTVSRRKTLALIGGGTIFAATAASVTFLSTRTPWAALAPWDQAGLYEEPRLRALSYAILAPNPHNLQPWAVELDGDDTVILHRDPAKALPNTDPFDRQITIGLGCFLEQMVIAASETGHQVDITLFPYGADGPVAEARFIAVDRPADLLAVAMLDRRSCKEPFDDRPVPSDAITTLSPLAEVVTDDARVTRLQDLTMEAWRIEIATPRTFQESVDVMRIGKAEINATPDGIDIGGPMLDSLALIGVMSREKAADPTSQAYASAEGIYNTMLKNTPAYAVIVTDQNDRQAQIAAGRRWMRLNLTATVLGLSLHPVSQALQEFPEMRAHYDEVHAMFAPDGGTVQMLGRLGYGPATPPAPRWPLADKVLA